MTHQSLTPILAAYNYCTGVLCIIFGFFKENAAAIGAMVVVLTFILQQYHNYILRKIAAKKENK